jgi:hypothetical protein
VNNEFKDIIDCGIFIILKKKDFCFEFKKKKTKGFIIKLKKR